MMRLLAREKDTDTMTLFNVVGMTNDDAENCLKVSVLCDGDNSLTTASIKIPMNSDVMRESFIRELLEKGYLPMGSYRYEYDVE